MIDDVFAVKALLDARNFRAPYQDDHLFILVHDPCGREFVFGPHALPGEIDETTQEHVRTCYAAVPLRRLIR